MNHTGFINMLDPPLDRDVPAAIKMKLKRKWVQANLDEFLADKELKQSG